MSINPGAAIGSGIAGIGGIVGAVLANNRARKNEKKARKFDKKADKELTSLQDYSIEDLYKKINLGKGDDDLHRYKTEKQIKLQGQGLSDFNRLAKDNLLSKVGRENVAFLKKRRDEGISANEALAMRSLLDSQRKAARRAQNTITQKAIERGADPMQANLTSRLLAAQANAEEGSEKAAEIANRFLERKLGASQLLEGSLASEFQRNAEIASARDRFRKANTDLINQGKKANWSRLNTISDKNVDLQNRTAAANLGNYLAGRKGVKDSKNKNKRTRSDYYGKQSSALRGQASQARAQENQNLRSGTVDIARMFSSLV